MEKRAKNRQRNQENKPIIKEENPILEDNKIHRDNEFGGAFIDVGISEFNKLGFDFGDSLKLQFSNGVTYKDVGYYSGYYVPAGKELVIGYQGYDFIKFCIYYGDDIYTQNNFNLDTTVTITINQKNMYNEIEETLNISYSNDPTYYPTIEEFTNFRMVKTTNIKKRAYV